MFLIVQLWNLILLCQTLSTESKSTIFAAMLNKIIQNISIDPELHKVVWNTSIIIFSFSYFCQFLSYYNKTFQTANGNHSTGILIQMQLPFVYELQKMFRTFKTSPQGTYIHVLINTWGALN